MDKELMSHDTQERIVEDERFEALRRRLEKSETVDNWYVRLSLRFSSVLNVAIV